MHHHPHQPTVIGGATLYRGDCLELLRGLQQPVDALITDPPYSSGGRTMGERARPPSEKYVTAREAAHNVDFVGDQRDARSWAFWMTAWLSLAREKIRPGGYAMCFTDWRQLPALTDAFQAAGFLWRGIVVWDKTEGSRAPHTGYFRHQCEYVVWGSLGPLKPAVHGGPWPGAIREPVKHREKLHMTGKPVRLMAELAKAVVPGGTILDPFMGSGSTGVAALQHGYRFVGMEQTEHYFDVSCRRLAAEQAALEGASKPG